MSCSFEFDRVGFPCLRFADLSVSLLPLTKLHYEHYLADAAIPENDTRYTKMLLLNPRISSSRCSAENREQLLLTGLTAAELEAFARWSGPKFRVPTVEEWRAIYREMQVFSSQEITACFERLAPLPRILFTHLRARQPVQTALDFSLMQGGVMEWVRDNRDWAQLGKPRREFLPNLWAPLRETVRQVHPRFCGGRLIRVTP
ncbi:MAG: hypothetical protein GY862_03745 [Gammaproteobacteria bacterium]|nr:hypothetical protein [Gammaproteobacteria bacterium]